MKGGPLEISCPIYGFVKVEPYERDIVARPAFQRLRRIRQLGWTDLVFPGAMHTRFEHSLGVMHMATALFDQLRQRNEERLSTRFHFDKVDFERHRRVVRLAALLHDVGHGPLSHVSEALLPRNPETGKPYRHEDYSIAVIKYAFADLLREYPEVTEIIGKKSDRPACNLWRQIISGEIDADRMDYLLRDAHHAGVPYGRYDWRRIVATVDFFDLKNDEVPRIGVRRGGRHAAESLLVARYMMFNCVYNHRTRDIIDHHLQEALREILRGDDLPPPTSDGIAAYLEWDDWRVLGALASGGGGEHGKRLLERRFDRQVWATPELPSAEELVQFKRVERALADLSPHATDSSRRWYTAVGAEELLVQAENDDDAAVPLSRCSNLIGGLRRSERHRLFVSEEKREEANRRLTCFPLKQDDAEAAGKAE
jgi:uncharacterized protein